MLIEWPKDPDGNDPFEGEDMRSRAIQELRDVTRTAIASLGISGRMSLDVLHTKLKSTEKADFIPSRSVVFDIFRLRATERSLRRFLKAIDVPSDQIEIVAERYANARTGGPKSASATPGKGSGIAERIAKARQTWDEPDVGSPQYRDPELAFPRDQLSQAFEAALAGALSREDVAFCSYSAAKHRAHYVEWIGICSGSPIAAEYLLDLILIPPPGQMIRPGLRAAYAAQYLDDALREAFFEVGMRLRGNSHGPTARLLEAVRRGTVVEHVRHSLESGDYPPGDAERIRGMLETDWAEDTIRTTARGQIEAYLSKIGESE